MSSYYRNPLTEHAVAHNHDLRDGSMGEPSGGETAAQHEQNKPKHPVDEALRPSHVLGGEKNASAPLESGTGLDVAGTGEERTQEGLRGSGKESAGVGGLEGREMRIGKS